MTTTHEFHVNTIDNTWIMIEILSYQRFNIYQAPYRMPDLIYKCRFLKEALFVERGHMKCDKTKYLDVNV